MLRNISTLGLVLGVFIIILVLSGCSTVPDDCPEEARVYQSVSAPRGFGGMMRPRTVWVADCLI